MTYWFRNRIRLGDKKLQSDETIRPLDESDVVTLSALPGPTGDGFTTADWLQLDGRGYESSHQAFAAGKRWRQYLSVAFARADIGANSDPTPLPQLSAHDRPESPEAPGLIVYPIQSGIINMRDEIWIKLDRAEPLDSFVSEALTAVRAAIPNGLDRRLELAYSLFHAALLNINPELRYILFVTAVEALIDDDQKKDKPIVEALTALREHVKTSRDFAPDVQEKLVKLLEEDEKESITQLGVKLAGKLNNKYDGKNPGTFFERVYNNRSRVLHGVLTFTGKKKRPTLREIERTNPHLRQFVLDLLTVMN